MTAASWLAVAWHHFPRPPNWLRAGAVKSNKCWGSPEAAFYCSRFVSFIYAERLPCWIRWFSLKAACLRQHFCRLMEVGPENQAAPTDFKRWHPQLEARWSGTECTFGEFTLYFTTEDWSDCIMTSRCVIMWAHSASCGFLNWLVLWMLRKNLQMNEQLSYGNDPHTQSETHLRNLCHRNLFNF